MPKSKVLKPFDYSFDGVTVQKASVGDEIDFLDMTAGLQKEGYVESFGEADPHTEPVVPTVPVVDEVVTGPAVDPAPEVTPEVVPEPIIEATPEPTVVVPPDHVVEPLAPPPQRRNKRR